jgi:molybdopterin converting factor small subunit
MVDLYLMQRCKGYAILRSDPLSDADIGRTGRVLVNERYLNSDMHYTNQNGGAGLIRIKIRFQGALRSKIGPGVQVSISGERATVTNILDSIKQMDEDVYETIMTKDDIVRPCILVLNQRRVDRLDHFDTVVKNGDELTIYPPILKR